MILPAGTAASTRVEEADELLVAVTLHAAPEARCRRARSAPRTAWSCRGACSRGSWCRRVLSSSAARAGCGRGPGSGSSRRWTAPRHAPAGDMYRPTMSSTFSAKAGSLESLKVRMRCGCQAGAPSRCPGPCADREANRLGHGATGPVGDLARRRGAGQRQHLGHGGLRHRRLARLAAAFPQQPVDAGFGIVPLPAPHRRPADAGPAGDLEHWQALGGEKHDAGTLNMLQRPTAIADDRGQTRAILGRHDDGYSLGHDRRIARSNHSVNPIFRSVH